VNQARLPNHATCPMEKKGFELCLGKRKMSASMRSMAPIEKKRERERECVLTTAILLL